MASAQTGLEALRPALNVLLRPLVDIAKSPPSPFIVSWSGSTITAMHSMGPYPNDPHLEKFNLIRWASHFTAVEILIPHMDLDEPTISQLRDFGARLMHAKFSADSQPRGFLFRENTKVWTGGREDLVERVVDAFPTVHGVEDDSCMICQEDYLPAAGIVLLPCHRTHYFHAQCIKPWFIDASTCPVCRKEI